MIRPILSAHAGQSPSLASIAVSETQPERPEPTLSLSLARSHEACCILQGTASLAWCSRHARAEGARPVLRGPHLPPSQQPLTNPEFEIVERMLVDLLDAFSQGEGEVSQGTQVSPLVFTLLQRT